VPFRAAAASTRTEADLQTIDYEIQTLLAIAFILLCPSSWIVFSLPTGEVRCEWDGPRLPFDRIPDKCFIPHAGPLRFRNSLERRPGNKAGPRALLPLIAKFFAKHLLLLRRKSNASRLRPFGPCRQLLGFVPFKLGAAPFGLFQAGSRTRLDLSTSLSHHPLALSKIVREAARIGDSAPQALGVGFELGGSYLRFTLAVPVLSFA
jgi:hypothetical protein